MTTLTPAIRITPHTWYNLETLSEYKADQYREYLRDQGIPFETSGNGEYIHIEILMTPAEMSDFAAFIRNLK